MRVLGSHNNLLFQSKQSLFKQEAMNETNLKWDNAIKREQPLETKPYDVRSPFERDKNRIMYSEGFDRLRYKTQVFYNPQNDMVSTRSTHTMLVSDISRNICRRLGLNEDLAEAIAQGHDIGHSPFGHDGEKAINKITQEKGLPKFWHEKNSLHMVDDILLLENSKGKQKNLDLTYAVRDGIINHCGEVNQNFIMPRHEFVDLKSINKPAQFEPYTWEGVVVKLSDKIAYLGRDIEDAKKMRVLKEKDLKSLSKLMEKHLGIPNLEPNNTNIVNLFINDVVNNSSPDKGIGFSKPVANLMDDIKEFNYKNIYLKPKLKQINGKKVDEFIKPVFDYYAGSYEERELIKNTRKNPVLTLFKSWLVKYVDNPQRPRNCENKILYNIKNPKEYNQAVVDFISGMTDKYLLKVYKYINKTK